MPEDKIPSDLIKKCSKPHEYVGVTKSSQCAKINVMTPEEIAQHYGIPTGSLANMRCKKVGCPFFKVGRRIFYRVDQWERWFFSTPVLTKEAIDQDLNR